MNDKKFVIIGIIVFLIIATIPLWFNRGKAAPAPELVLTDRAKAAKECVRSKDYMTREHTKVLDLWRHTVVRHAERIYVNPSGKEFTMSLSNTCLDCHSNKTEFCDRCHDYASVRPYCWDCHIDNPKESK
jgi:hypothetical protein